MRYLTILFLALITAQAWGADCSATDITLSSQLDVDNFQTTYGGGGVCDAIAGDLKVSGADITSLAPLSALSMVNGDLDIRDNGNLTDLSGLSNLVSVGENLFVKGNETLTDIDALANLVSIGGDFYIQSNTALTNLRGLANLSIFSGVLYIQGNTALTNIDGLSELSSLKGLYISQSAVLTDIDGLANLTSIESGFGIVDNPSLTNIDALANITNVGTGGVSISGNATLTDVDGLANLTIVDGPLDIYQNAALSNIDGLVNLTNVEGMMQIGYLDTLTNLNGLANLDSVGGELHIFSNAALTDIDGLVNLASIAGGFSISSNEALTNIDGMSGVINFGGDFVRISYNASLTNIDGLVNFTHIEQDLKLENNGALTNLDGISNLESVGYLAIVNNTTLTNLDGFLKLISVGRDLHFYGNTLLGDCSAMVVIFGWPLGPPDDSIGGSINLSRNASGCNSVEEILASVTGPTTPVITSATVNDQQITLEFVESTTTDRLYPIEGYEADCIGDSAENYFDPDVAESIPDEGGISLQLDIHDFGPVSVLSEIEIEIDIDITHPRTRHLVVTLTSPEGTTLTLWDEGVGTGTDLIGTFPTSLTPVDDLSQIANEDLNGTWTLQVNDVIAGYEGALNSWGITVQELVTEYGANSPITIGELTNGQEYSCTVTPVTKLGVFPASNEVMATPMIPEIIFKHGFESE
ncbi:proprotein convertase P-domain-containing protein [Pseudomonadota bacterium]